MKNLKVVTYKRQATADQFGHNTFDIQDKQIKAYCNQNGFEIVASFQDIASGKRKNNEGLMLAVDYLNDSTNNANVLVALSVDRISRDFLYSLQFIETLKQRGINVVSIMDNK